MKSFLVVFTLLFSFSIFAQVELYDLGKSGPSLFASITRPHTFNPNYVVNGRLGIGANFVIPTSNIQRVLGFSASYAILKKQNTYGSFTIPISVNYLNSRDSERLVFSSGLTGKIYSGQKFFSSPFVSLNYSKPFYEDNSNKEDWFLNMGLTFVFNYVAISGYVVNMNNPSRAFGLAIGFVMSRNNWDFDEEDSETTER